ncbi:hypothetical protein HDV06_007044 [Boothiomyces sp. JEL0866]|nr:hypothetical protein HDV06_007044 [Boothiomyces sp. JEL0866]
MNRIFAICRYTTEATRKQVRPNFRLRPKNFLPKTTYSPADLNDKLVIEERELRKPRQEMLPTEDIFAKLNIDPLKEYKNPVILSSFLTKMGHIQPRRKTGLSLDNQKKLARAIKRARAFGILPFSYQYK